MSDNTTHSFEEATTREWVVTNGIGGYASSTVCGLSTRRYHGLLVASLNPPTERKVLVAKIDEEIRTPAATYKISTNRYSGGLHPEGYRNLRSFSRDPLPCMHFQAGPVQLKKKICMVHNSNTTIIEYRNEGEESFQLWLNPLYAGRDYHGLLRENSGHAFKVSVCENHQVISCENMPPLYFGHSCRFTEGVTWHHNFEYAIEKQRGMDHTEDLVSSGYLEITLDPGQSTFLVFSLDEKMIRRLPAELVQEEINRLRALVPAGTTDAFLADLIVCAEQFIVKRNSTSNFSIIAGYHWFTDWGRDSMIAIRGLCIATGRQKEAESVILTFLSHLRHGLIPNRFPDSTNDEPEYHTIDATLWLFVAVYDFDRKFNDNAFLEKTLPRLREILLKHLEGTIHSIHVTPTGLLSGGTPGLPLTWMDARIENHCFTPRRGCPVEISALWFNALKIYEYACGRLGQAPDDSIKGHAEQVQASFVKSFWNHEGYLNDCINPAFQPDHSIRPNQVYVLSLPFRLLPEEMERQVLETIRKTLLTDYGLRTLDRHDPHFRSTYGGDLWKRDEAYHQGTVWPFLLPEYLAAYLRLNGNSDTARAETIAMLQKLKSHFYNDGCVNGISEIFDGLYPERGKGCMNQAWSVSNLLMLIINNNLSV